MNEKWSKRDSFREALKMLVTDEAVAAIDDGDEDRVFAVVTSMTEILAEAIGMARLCDDHFVEDALLAISQDLSTGVDQARPRSWPTMFISSEVEAS